MANTAEDIARRKRINRYKKIITYFVFVMMVVPLVLCGILYMKLVKMEKKLDSYIRFFNEHRIEESLQNNKNNQEETTLTDETISSGDKTTVDKETESSEKVTSESDEGQTTESSTTIKPTPGQTTTEQVTVNQNTTEQGTTEESTTVQRPTLSYSSITPYQEWNAEQLAIINQYKDMGKGKKIYLTFDDGPSVYTKEIIEILNYYGVKATFFVNGREDIVSIEGYKAIVNSGNVIGLHTYTHVYDEIYSSVENFSADLLRLQTLVYNLTGVKSYYFRFPGGSSTQMIPEGMTIYNFIDYLQQNGYSYYDWNAANGDGVSATLPIETLVTNIMKDAIRKDNSIALMHDAKRNRTTVDSLPLLIETLINAGFEICPIDENTPLIQQRKPNNNVENTQ